MSSVFLEGDYDMNKITVYPEKKLHCLGDLYGIFFEDLNHAADGGLYAEMVRNRSFEFDKIDNYNYNHLTAWEKFGDGDFEISVENSYPLNRNNTHYLVIDIKSGTAGVRNLGFNGSMFLRGGEEYNFSLYARRETGFSENVSLVMSNAKTGEKEAEASFKIKSAEWEKYELSFVTEKDSHCFLNVFTEGRGKVYMDDISLFPRNTFKGRKNGMRNDIATLLAELKPKFMRFPGGCLVHDGSLDPNARDSLYRWKNTLGDVSQRPSRKSNWGYNQTLGLGYYEYFQFCEDIGAKPLPVLPAAYNPHRKIEVPIDELKPWIDDALDLIEFANGDENTPYGSVRASLGHKEPFGLEYIAIGNEEVGEGFIERFPYFQNAIKEKYPEIKVIASSGPFPCGGEFDKGWDCARKNKADLVDEHYYVAPQWLLANNKRYFDYDKSDPKVFLGEYASWGNTLYNALAEASYMTAMEKSGVVELACYAPLLANVDYVNWRPDMIYFNGEKSFGSINYYVQKMFMTNQGDCKIDETVESSTPSVSQSSGIYGDIQLQTIYTKAQFYDVKLNGKAVELDSEVEKDGIRTVDLKCDKQKDFTLELKAKEIEGIRGFTIRFGIDTDIYYRWEFGGWQNQDSALCSHISNRESVLTHELKSVEQGREYSLKLTVSGNEIRCFIDGEMVHEVVVKDVVVEPIYVTSSLDKDGDIIIKAVNILDSPYEAEIETNAEISSVYAEVLTGEMNDENSFEEPKKVSPKETSVNFKGSVISHTFPKNSLTVIRVKI
jgi:alpha-L-arabinofuranosidase